METKDILKELRKKKSMTGQEVADGCGMAYKVYQAYESGARNLGVPALEKLADFYGVTTDYLLGRNNSIEIDIVEMVSKAFDFNDLERAFFELYVSYTREERTKFLKGIMNNLRKAVTDIENNMNNT